MYLLEAFLEVDNCSDWLIRPQSKHRLSELRHVQPCVIIWYETGFPRNMNSSLIPYML